MKTRQQMRRNPASKVNRIRNLDVIFLPFNYWFNSEKSSSYFSDDATPSDPPAKVEKPKKGKRSAKSMKNLAYSWANRGIMKCMEKLKIYRNIKCFVGLVVEKISTL